MKRKSLLFMLLFALLAPWAAQAQVELTVHDGTNTNNYVPIYGLWADAYLKCEMVYPATELAEMAGGTINSIKFYASSPAAEAWTGTWQVSLMEVDNTTISAFAGPGTVVYEGLLDGTQSEMEITFTTSYTYTGGNLLVCVYQTANGNYKSITWTGEEVTGASIQGYSSSSLDAVSPTQRNFLPKTTFTYTPGVSDCDMPTAITVRDITTDGATVTWEGDGNAWNLRYKASTDADYTMVENLTSATYTLSSLEENTTYNVGVQTVCTGSTSFFKSTSFTTADACAAPSNLQVSDLTASSATLSWTPGYQETTWTVKYKKSADAWDDANVETVSGTPTLSLTGLDEFTTYNVRVFNCTGDNDPYLSGSFTTKETCPDGKICIGEGNATNSYLPTYTYYNYSLTQQIYTAEEIGAEGAILSIDFYKSGTAGGARNFDIYLVSTEKTSFEGQNDWIAATANDLVYSGSVTFADNDWTTIELDNPFTYDGHSNVALIIDDNSGSYVSAPSFFVFEATGQAIRIYSDGTNYDPTAPSEYNGTVLNVKNRVRLVVGEPPACAKPTGLTVNYEGGTEATISWTSDATAWNMKVNGTEINGTITNPYTLTGLELATTYEVEVQANCGDATSEWAGPVSFTTDLCMPEDQCALTFVVTDSYGDGWNGASIDIYDYTGEQVGELLASISNTSAAGAGEAQTYTVNFCNGQELAIVWTSGNFDSEASYTVTDLNGDVVVEGSGAGFDAFAYTINCTVTDCRTPSDFVASEIGGHSVVLSWTENGPATEWVITYTSENDEEPTQITVNTNPYTLTGLTPETRYAAQVTPVCEVDKPSEVIIWTTDVACPAPNNLTVIPTPSTAQVSWVGEPDSYVLEYAEYVSSSTTIDPVWLQYEDEDESVTSIGSGSQAYMWTWGVMYPSTMLGGNTSLTKLKIYENDAEQYYTGYGITVEIYSGGDDAPGSLIATEEVTQTGTEGWHEINLADPVTIDPTQNLWIVLTTAGYYTMPAVQTTEANNQWVQNYDEETEEYYWANIGDLSSSLAGYGWMIRAYLNSVDAGSLQWITVNDVTSPYTIQGLQGETEYAVRVKGICGGEDGESAWTMVTFTTPSACATPIDLAAEVEGTTATLSWSDYQESYNLKYRHTEATDPTAPATIILEADDVWEDGSGYQMLLDADATTYGTLWNANHYILVDGEQYTGGDLPTTYYDEFEYKIPEGADGALTTTNVVVTGSVTLTIPAGTYDYVILNPTPGDRFYIAADNGEVPCAGDDYVFEPGVTYHFTMQRFGSGDGAAFEVDRPMSDWTTVTVNEVPYTLSNLNPETYYEWQVQGVNCDGNGQNTEWSEIANFTTGEQTTSTLAVDLIAGTNWFSTNVVITLDDLKNALVAAMDNATNTTIKAKNGNSTTYNGTRWRGNLTTLDVAQMYKINAAEACTIRLEGEPVNPAEHPVTIQANATNWIGIPLANNMTVTDAFAGFAQSGDQIKAKNGGSSTYNGTRWRGSLSTLEPGQGYVFTSGYSQDRELVFPTASSKSAQTIGQSNMSGQTSVAKTKKQDKKEITLAPKAIMKPVRSAKDMLNK